MQFNPAINLYTPHAMTRPLIDQARAPLGNEKTASVAHRVFAYVLPGALIGTALSIATWGISSLFLALGGLEGFAQELRQNIEAKGSLEKVWAELETAKKVALVGLAFSVAALGGITAFFLAASPFAVKIALLVWGASSGIVSGALFAANFTTPPLLHVEPKR